MKFDEIFEVVQVVTVVFQIAVIVYVVWFIVSEIIDKVRSIRYNSPRMVQDREYINMMIKKQREEYEKGLLKSCKTCSNRKCGIMASIGEPIRTNCEKWKGYDEK